MISESGRLSQNRNTLSRLISRFPDFVLKRSGSLRTRPEKKHCVVSRPFPLITLEHEMSLTCDSNANDLVNIAWKLYVLIYVCHKSFFLNF